MRPVFKLTFWAIVAAQLALLIVLIGAKEYILRTGFSVVLQAVPVDPRSLVQGDYVILRYEISTLPTDYRYTFSSGMPVYVSLQEKDGVWRATQYSQSAPGGGRRFISGTLGGDDLVAFGIETYFVPEGSGRIVERAGDVKVQVSLSGSGKAVIEEVLVDGELFSGKQQRSIPEEPRPSP